MSISHTELKRLLHYDPETGIWTWLYANHRHKIGERADRAKDGRGYRVVRMRVAGKLCWWYAHRLAWFYMTGEWPRFVDHKDTNKDNNVWENLRKSTKAQNAANTRARIRSHKGASFIKKLGRYRAQICVQGRHIHLGYTKTAEEAQELYRTAAEKYHGEFARAR